MLNRKVGVDPSFPSQESQRSGNAPPGAELIRAGEVVKTIMSNALGLIRNKTQGLTQSQLGAVSFEYVLVIGGVSVILVAFLAVGADAIMKQLLIEGVCEKFDDLLTPSSQWWCHGGPAWTF